MARPKDRPRKTAVLVAQRIVADIRRRGHVPGDRLPPEKLMLSEYSVGRGTLRESLRFLELQGVISLKPGPGGGPVVEVPDASGLARSLLLLLQFNGAPFTSVIEARSDLEPLLAGLAAQRMADEQLKEIGDTIEAMREGMDDRDVFLESDRRFHEAIAWSSGNPMHGFLVEALLEMIDDAALGVDYPARYRTAVVNAHSRVYKALKNRDTQASMTAMRRHLDDFVGHATRQHPDRLTQPVSWGLPG